MTEEVIDISIDDSSQSTNQSITIDETPPIVSSSIDESITVIDESIDTSSIIVDESIPVTVIDDSIDISSTIGGSSTEIVNIADVTPDTSVIVVPDEDEEPNVPTVSEQREDRRQRRVMGGMAAMLAMMRESNEPEKEVDEETPVDTVAVSTDQSIIVENNVAAPTDQSIIVENTVAAPTDQSIIVENTVAAPTDQSTIEIEDSVDPNEERISRKAMSGMATMLSMMRESNETNEKSKVVNIGGGGVKLNRQERRALMRAQGMFDESAKKNDNIVVEKKKKEESMVTVTERRRVKINTVDLPESPSFIESTVFNENKTTNGYQPVVHGNNYVRSCLFSNSGKYISTTSQDRHLRIFSFDENDNKLSLSSSSPLGGIIYDTIWHPIEDWIATSSRDHPIHIWNHNGERIVSFRGINHLDELSSANSISFSRDGSLLYGGYHKYLRVFDMNRPGKQIREIKTWNRESGGQKALLSCIAVHPFYSGVFAVGCYGRSIGLYSDRSRSFADCLFSIDFPALTQLEYSNDGLKLYASTRNDSSIVCYDMRNPGQVLTTFNRPGHTNQKFTFDLDGSDRYLFSGSSTGELLVFDTLSGDKEAINRRRVTKSALVGVSIHPSSSIIATCSGERIFRVMDISDDEEDEIESKRIRIDKEEEEEEKYSDGRIPIENSLHIWRMNSFHSI